MESSNNSSIAITEQGAQVTFIIYITGETVMAAPAAAGNGLVMAAMDKVPARHDNATRLYVRHLLLYIPRRQAAVESYRRRPADGSSLEPKQNTQKGHKGRIMHVEYFNIMHH